MRIPAVIDSTTNFMEHPELVAERLGRYGSVVGRENIISGSDCGFGTGAISTTIHPSIAWATLEAMAEGACIQAHHERWLVIGKTSQGRFLTVVVGARP